jgi:hypothetical protein
MSMSDALRNLKDRVPWLAAAHEEPTMAPPPLTVLQEMEELVRMAGVTGTVIDRQSSTWVAVSQWAASELLETFSKLESADDTKALRARAKTLRELLAMNIKPQVAKIENQGPYIP